MLGPQHFPAGQAWFCGYLRRCHTDEQAENDRSVNSENETSLGFGLPARL